MGAEKEKAERRPVRGSDPEVGGWGWGTAEGRKGTPAEHPLHANTTGGAAAHARLAACST